MPSTAHAARCSSWRIFSSRSRVMSAGVESFEPASPLVMHTVTISLPARAHVASVPATVNSWSSGCAWIDITRAGALIVSAVFVFAISRSSSGNDLQPHLAGARAVELHEPDLLPLPQPQRAVLHDQHLGEARQHRLDVRILVAFGMTELPGHRDELAQNFTMSLLTSGSAFSLTEIPAVVCGQYTATSPDRWPDFATAACTCSVMSMISSRRVERTRMVVTATVIHGLGSWGCKHASGVYDWPIGAAPAVTHPVSEKGSL